MIGTAKKGPLRAEAIFARKRFILKNFGKTKVVSITFKLRFMGKV